MPVWFVKALIKIRKLFTLPFTLLSATVFVVSGVIYHEHHWDTARYMWTIELIWLSIGIVLHILFSFAMFMWMIRDPDVSHCPWLGDTPSVDDIILFVLCGPQESCKEPS